jgi:hypothetical protein
MSELMLDVDQAREIKAALRRGNWTNAEIKKACEGDLLAQARQVLLGHAEIRQLRYVVDCDADPRVLHLPKGWKVTEHRKGGQFLWDSAKVGLYLTKCQKGPDRPIQGTTVHKELKGRPVFNVNLLEYLLMHPHLIPENWKKVGEGCYQPRIYFWGTIYLDRDGELAVWCLCWHEGRWHKRPEWVGVAWDRSPAACLVQSAA